METLERGARAQYDSRLLVAMQEDLDAQVRVTLAIVRARRAERREARERSRRSQSDS